MNYVDSCYVEKDTSINDIVFMKVIKPVNVWSETEIYFLRDSLHYIVDARGTRLFSAQDFTNELAEKVWVSPSGDTARVDTYKMTDLDSIITTPSGNFVTLNYQGSYYYPTLHLQRWWNTRYAKNTGIVEEDLGGYLSQPSLHYIRKLLRYHVQ